MFSQLLVFLLALTLVSCGNKERPFKGNPADSDVLTKTTSCEDEDGEVSLEPELTSGSSPYKWAEAVGCVERPIKQAWGVLHDLKNFVSEKYKGFKVVAPPADVDFAYESHYIGRKIPKVEWWFNWYHTVKEGDVDEPEQILVNFQMERGNTLLKHWKGTFVLEQDEDPEYTRVAIRVEMDVPRTSVKDAEESVTTWFSDLAEAEPICEPIDGCDE